MLLQILDLFYYFTLLFMDVSGTRHKANYLSAFLNKTETGVCANKIPDWSKQN